MGRLTSKEIFEISSFLNESVNIPLLTEGKEQIVFEKIIKMIDDSLYQLLPDEIYDTIHIVSDGITSKEAKIVKIRVSKILNKQIDIPFISEEQEKELISKFLDLIELAIQNGKDLTTSITLLSS